LIEPIALIPLVLTWLAVLVLTGWVGLASMLAAVSLVLTFFWWGVSMDKLWFAVALAVFVIFTHRSNIVNMLNGSEYKFQRVRIVNWFR
jgi:glycerol-3-phosphate acyltransferase PlsY